MSDEKVLPEDAPMKALGNSSSLRALLNFLILLNPKVSGIITLYSPRYFFVAIDPITPRALFAK